MSLIKTPNEISFLEEAGKRLAFVMQRVTAAVKIGITTKELDTIAEQLIREGGDFPSFLGYTPPGSKKPYPATLCISVNDEVVHGIPGDRVILEGDIVGLDLGLAHKGFFVDMAETVPVENITKEDKNLIDITKKALHEGIGVVRDGVMSGAIGHAIESFVKPYGYGLVKELGGHGVGHAVHEEPFIPNFGSEKDGILLCEGMVIAIEPMLTGGKGAVRLAGDGYTIVTRDGTKSAHFEHTVVVTKNGAHILTA